MEAGGLARYPPARGLEGGLDLTMIQGLQTHGLPVRVEDHAMFSQGQEDGFFGQAIERVIFALVYGRLHELLLRTNGHECLNLVRTVV